MLISISHHVHQSQDFETVTAEGDVYETARNEAMAKIPDGRIGASIRVER